MSTLPGLDFALKQMQSRGWMVDKGLPYANSEDGDCAGGDVEIPCNDLKVSHLNFVSQNIAACSELLSSGSGVILNGIYEVVSWDQVGSDRHDELIK